MILELCEEDLKEEFQKKPISEMKFEHFNDKAQNAIRSVGQATFYRYRNTSIEDINIISPPDS